MELTGSFIAIACAIHCMAIPVMVGLGSAGVVHLFDHLFIELGFLFATMTFAGWSLFVNYRKGNVDTLPISLFIIGFTLLIISIVFHFHALSAVGGIHIAVAHYFNWKQLRSN